MARWEAVIPGSAERIFQMVENQERHRIRLEEAAVRAEIRSGYMGVVAALIVALAAMGTSAFIAWVGQPVAGAGLGGATLVALVGAFLKANNDRRQERLEKARLIAGSR